MNAVPDNAQGVVLAALQDNHRATLVGEPMRCDGAVRQLFPLPDHGGSVTVLTGRLERADKARGWPVLPDRVVGLTEAQHEAIQRWLRAKDLPELPPGTDDRPPDDPQLAAALAVLRDALGGK